MVYIESINWYDGHEARRIKEEGNLNVGDPCRLTFKLEGPGLESDVNLYHLITSFSEFHSTLDKTYAVLTGQHRLSRIDRNVFQVKASDFRQGSFISTLEIVVTGTQLTLPLLGLANPYSIWEYTKSGFEFLKAIYVARNEGRTPEIRIGDNSQAFLFLGDGNQLTVSDPRIVDIANRTKRNYARLAEVLGEDGINKIAVSNISSPSATGISLDMGDKQLFEIPTNVSDTPAFFEADIFHFNKEKNNGRLRVLDGQGTPAGEYPFSVIGDQDNSKYIQSMLHNKVKVTALEEQENDPIDGPKLVRFQVIEIG